MARAQAIEKKLLGIRATPEQRKMLTEAAAREHRSVNSFVMNAAMMVASAGLDESKQRTRRSPDEVRAIIAAARDEIRRANPTNRNLVAELIAERRAEAARE